MSRRFWGFWRVALVLGMAATALAQTSYTAIDLGTLGGSWSVANGINASGQVVGVAETSTGNDHAFLYSGGTMMDLGTLGGPMSSATAVNASGQVVGWSDRFDGYEHAFLHSGGTMIDLGTLGGLASDANGINARGQVVGWSDRFDGYEHAFLYSGGTMIDLGTLGGFNSDANGINASGQVVGIAETPPAEGHFHAFLYGGGNMIDLGTLGGSVSPALGINASGQVVGWSETSAGEEHAFLYSGGSMIDLGTLGGTYSQAQGINANGQVVGIAYTSTGEHHAFLYRGGAMTDLNSLVTLRTGVYLWEAVGINDNGQITANGSDGHAYLLTPASGVKVTNPYAPYASGKSAPGAIDATTALNAPVATGVAADGLSAVVLAFQTTSRQPVDFTIAATGTGLAPGTPVGSLSTFDPNYLINPSPPANNSRQELEVRDSTCDASGTCTFLALLWGPNAMPVPNRFPLVLLAVTATQQGGASSKTGVTLIPPPLLLVHGIWSSAAGAGFTAGSHGFHDWIASEYPHGQIFGVDYSAENSREFDDPATQEALLQSMGNALASAAASGMAARTVDIVAHSMGGLVARYFLSTAGSMGNPALLPNSVHRLITIGTPHHGSQLATTLVNNQNQTTVLVAASPVVWALCRAFSSCTLGDVMGVIGKPVDTGAQSLEPGSPQLGDLSASNEFSAIVGQAPTPLSLTEVVLDVLIKAFLPGQTVASILGNKPNDTIVPVNSQNPGSAGQTDSATVSGIVHASICLWSACTDVDETHSQSVWEQAFYWLTGGSGPAPAANLARENALTPATVAPPVLDLTGYTQASASNVTISPATGSVLTINSATNITATSSTKTITEVLLLQTVADPTDTPLMFATQSPFMIAFTPTRLGSANFAAITVFSDSTYAVTPLSYTLQPPGIPLTLTLVNAPVASVVVGTSTVVGAKAVYASGPLDVTQAATYTTGSGTSNVFQVGAGGTITATGNGEDQLNVSYGGLTVSAWINAGSCTYSLSPSNQIVPNTGGPVTIQVTAPAGCAWTAMGGSSWLSLMNASGVGNGSIRLTAVANNSGNTQYATITLDGIPAAVTQPATACTYGVSQSQINAPAAGTSGTITVTTSCPVVVSSDANWVTGSGGSSPVSYAVAANNGGSQRTATLTVGTQAIPVVQAGSVIPGLTGSSLNPGSAAAGGPAFTLTVNGTNFVSGAVVQWNGAALVTTFVNATQLTAGVPTVLIASAGMATVTVVNPGGAISGGVGFTIVTAPLRFIPMTPCRIVDTRNPAGPFGGPAIAGGTARGFTLPSSTACNIPTSAAAWSLNVTVVPPGQLNYVTVWPSGQPQPLVSTLNSLDGRIKANAAIIPAGTGGAVSVYAYSDTDLILDIDGYFVPATDPSALAFYPLTPCRVADTRDSSYGSQLGPPALSTGENRTFAILSSACHVPASAQAYSLNFTVVPPGPVNYITTYPTGQARPLASTLNDLTGTITANAAIVPAGAGGSVDVYTYSAMDLVIDINGYFAPPGVGGLSLYNLTPCRVLDTRLPAGSAPFSGERDVNVTGSGCGAPAGAQAYVFNATVVPPGPMNYLTLWPQGGAQPWVSTLNALDGAITSNMALVPTTNGSIAAYVYVPTPAHLILDIFGYFAP
ncbi:MAG: hypothetical protein ABSH47_19390 [Bryobacteraceae bacterium]|jgi:probable HAF family extracellular repeat protein